MKEIENPTPSSRTGGIQIAGWINEDELPESYPYDVMFQHSKVDGVRLFPVFAPEEMPSPSFGGANKLGQTAIQRAQSDFMEFLAQDGYLDTDRCLEPKSTEYIQTLLDKLCDEARRDLRLELAATIREGISAVADARSDAKDSPKDQVMGADVAAKFELWFFRDMFESNRLALFSLFGLKAADMDTMGKQQKVLRRILSALSATATQDRLSGIELAARFVEARLKAYVEENGSYDPSTGTMEYPGDGSQYVYELEEIIEGIRAIATTEGE